jgi:hypothetical protein
VGKDGAIMAEPNGVDLTREGVQDIANLTLDGKREAATSALQTLGSNAVNAKKEIATTAVQTLGANAVDAKKEIATTTLQMLPPDKQQEVIGQIQPTQKVSDRIWQWIVGAFAIVFVGGSGTLVASVFFLEVEQIQVLLTVFTTVAGILAGFISGRASASERTRPSG